MNIFKKLIASVMAMCVCAALFTTAYADTHSYSLRNASGAPSSVNVHTQTFGSYCPNGCKKLKNSCTTFNTGYYSNGEGAYANFYSWYVTSTGDVVESIHVAQKIEHLRDEYTVLFKSDSYVPNTSTVYTRYVLSNYNGIAADIRGTLTH